MSRLITIENIKNENLLLKRIRKVNTKDLVEVQFLIVETTKKLLDKQDKKVFKIDIEYLIEENILYAKVSSENLGLSITLENVTLNKI